MTVTMNETQAQRDAERIREHAPKLLAALQMMCGMWASVCFGRGWEPEHLTEYTSAREAIEYATGAHDPSSYPEDGYEVDAAGTFKG